MKEILRTLIQLLFIFAGAYYIYYMPIHFRYRQWHWLGTDIMFTLWAVVNMVKYVFKS